MKKAPLLALASLLCAGAFAEYQFNRQAYIAEYTTIEKCYECNYRLAIYCGSGAIDCGVPGKLVSHFQKFDTEEQALQEMANNKEASFDFIALWKASELPVSVKKLEVEVPIPPRHEIQNTFEYKGKTYTYKNPITYSSITAPVTSGTISFINGSSTINQSVTSKDDEEPKVK